MDPQDLRQVGTTQVTSFNVATNRSFTTGAGVKVEETIWWKVSVWGNLATACKQYLHKSSKVLVDGNMVPGKDGNPVVYVKKDGTPAANYEIRANVVKFLDSKGDVIATHTQQDSDDEWAVDDKELDF